jgi:hypothetical protein
MGHRTLERVYVRMLFDPAFVDAVYADAARALAGLDLEPAEREGLVAVDRRSWGHDPLRRYRTLRTLAEEFKASTTLALAATRSLASLDAFFSSEEFHGAVQGRGSLALAFADYLARLDAGSPQLPDVLRLERMLARCRRELDRAPSPPAPAGPGAPLALAPGHAAGAAGRFNANVLEAVNAAERYLFEVGLMPAVALCDDAPRLEPLPPVAAEPVHLLALPSTSGVSLMPLDDPDYFLLLDQFSAGPRPRAEAVAAAGVAGEDAEVMVESLLDAAVLVRSP